MLLVELAKNIQMISTVQSMHTHLFYIFCFAAVLLQQKVVTIKEVVQFAGRESCLSHNAVCSWDPQNHTWEVTEVLQPAIITIDWQRKNRTLFKSVNFAGYIGILTAIKPVSVRYHNL